MTTTPIPWPAFPRTCTVPQIAHRSRRHPRDIVAAMRPLIESGDLRRKTCASGGWTWTEIGKAKP
jgi:hypothetical protein